MSFEIGLQRWCGLILRLWKNSKKLVWSTQEMREPISFTLSPTCCSGDRWYYYTKPAVPDRPFWISSHRIQEGVKVTMFINWSKVKSTLIQLSPILEQLWNNFLCDECLLFRPTWFLFYLWQKVYHNVGKWSSPLSPMSLEELTLTLTPALSLGLWVSQQPDFVALKHGLVHDPFWAIYC